MSRKRTEWDVPAARAAARMLDVWSAGVKRDIFTGGLCRLLE
jgi:hypothetical protein